MNKTNFYCVIVVLALFFTYSVHAQSVDEFQKRFSGNTCFSNGTMTISSSGYLKMPNKAQRYFIWDVPTNVSKIVDLTPIHRTAKLVILRLKTGSVFSTN